MNDFERRFWSFALCFAAGLPLFVAAGCEVRRGLVEARSYVPDARSQAAGWMAYRAVCTPAAAPVPPPVPPKVDPQAPKPAAPVKPRVQLNTFGLPVGVPPAPR